MEVKDFIIFFVYVLIFYKLFKIRSNRFSDEVCKRYFMLFYFVKVVSCLLLTMFIIYLSPSDASGIFFPEARNIFAQIVDDPRKLNFFFTGWQDHNGLNLLDDNAVGYLKIASNLLVIKLIIFFLIFSFGGFLTTSFLFSLIAFEGMWRLFLFFYKINPAKHKIIAICFLFLPTTVFWTSGIVKEALSFGCLGFLSFSFYNLYILKKNVLLNIILVVLFSMLLFTVKNYTLIAYLPLLIIFLVRHNSVIKIQNRFFRFLYIALLLAAVSLAGYFYIDANQDLFKNFALDAVTDQITSQSDEFKRQADDATSSFELGVIYEPTPAGMVKAIPFAVAATLFRPFVWEAKKITTLLSALESLAFFLVTIWVFVKCGIGYTVVKIVNNRLVFFCFSFAIIFAFFCGISTLNFGSLVRYKLPCLPFYLYALLMVYDFKKNKVEARSKVQE